MNRNQQLEIIERLIPQGRTRMRTNCPFCGAKNTLSITREGGNLLYQCYRASCPVAGGKQVARTIDEMRRALGLTHHEKAAEFELPDHLVNVLTHEPAVAYLRRNHSLQAYVDRRALIKYDPRLDRVVFCVSHERKVVGATGRALNKETKPKWFRYDAAGYPFIVGDSATAVIVEDAASACAVSSVATGIALLGTNLANSYLGSLKNYKQVIIALDPDAMCKAIDMERSLAYFANVRTAQIEDDLKYFQPSQIAKMLNIC
jgi:hypothetical protein